VSFHAAERIKEILAHMMTLDQSVRKHMGDLVFQLCNLEVELANAHARIKELEGLLNDTTKDTPGD
jgi:hypothetical protein